MLEELIIFVFGFIIGYLYSIWRVSKLIVSLSEKEGISVRRKESIDEEDSDKVKVLEVHRLEVEQVGEVLYLYNRHTKTFLCQGASLDTLAKTCKETLSIITAIVVYNDTVYTFVDGVSKEFVNES